MLTRTQLKKIQKSMKNGTGTDIKISKTQIRKVGGNIFSLATNFLPKVMPAVSKIGGPLLTGALAGLGENLIDKIFGEKGGMIIPMNKLTQKVPMLNLFTAKQERDLNNAYQTGGNMHLTPTKKQMQHGGFWGALASIGIPLAMNLIPKLFGKGLQVDISRSRRSIPVFLPKMTKTNYEIPPVHGFGIRKKKETKKTQRIASRPKFTVQKHSHFGKDTLTFVNKPLSNFHLIDWVKKFGIKHFREIYSRDNLPSKIRKECGIINLDTMIGPGTHWVCYRNIDKQREYFDSFGLKMPKEVANYLNTSNKQIFYSGDEIQERLSVLCGYWCLYYLLERQNEKKHISNNP